MHEIHHPRHSRGLPRHSRGHPSFPRTREPREKQSTPPNLPFAPRRGRVRSTQGMPENHQHPPSKLRTPRQRIPSFPPPPSFPQISFPRTRAEKIIVPPKPTTPPPTTTVPSPASNHPSPSQGETKRGSLVRAQGGAGHPTTQQHTPITAVLPQHNPPSFPSFQIFRIIVQTLIPLIVREFH